MKVTQETRRYIAIALVCTSIFSVADTQAQEDISYREGNYEIFYSAFNTSFISPEVATAAGIERAKNRGMLNISIIEHLEPDEAEKGRGASTTRPAEVEYVAGEIFDLVHSKPIKFKEIVEPAARYHLGAFKIANDNEFKEFRIRVLPKGSKNPIEFRFKRNLFID